MEVNLSVTQAEEPRFYTAGHSASLYLMRAGPDPTHLCSLPPVAPASHCTSAQCFCLFQLISSSPALLPYLLHRPLTLTGLQLNIMSVTSHLSLLLTQVHDGLPLSSREQDLSSPAHLLELGLTHGGYRLACTGASLGKMPGLAPASCDSGKDQRIDTGLFRPRG